MRRLKNLVIKMMTSIKINKKLIQTAALLNEKASDQELLKSCKVTRSEHPKTGDFLIKIEHESGATGLGKARVYWIAQDRAVAELRRNIKKYEVLNKIKEIEHRIHCRTNRCEAENGADMIEIHKLREKIG